MVGAIGFEPTTAFVSGIQANDYSNSFLMIGRVGERRMTSLNPARMNAEGMPVQAKAGGISSAPVSLLDIAPTILSQCGQVIPESYQGEDLTNLLDNPESVDSRTMFAEQSPLGKFHGETDWRMVLGGDWKFIWNRNDHCELYHLASDPDEKFNHYGESEHQGISESLRSRLIEWMIDTSDPLAAECQSS